MLELFDMYVDGIDPQRTGDLEEIKKNVGIMLRIEGQELERLFSFKGDSICVQKNISEKGAINLRDKLVKLGLICSYSASRTANLFNNLSLVPLEEKSNNLFTCPACKKQHPLIGNVEPKVCPYCAVYVDKYLKVQKEKKEHESQSQREYEEQEKLKEQERQRQALMEAQIAKELGLQSKSVWKSLFLDAKQTRKSYLVVASIVVIGLAGLAVYKFLPNQNSNNDPLATDISELSAIPEQLPPEQTSSVTATEGVPENTTQETMVVAEGELPSQGDIIDTKPTPNAQELVVLEGQTPAQAALVKGHADVAKFMNSMGIDTSNKATKGSASTSTGQTKQSLTSTENRIFLDSIYRELDSDIEWDAFLNKKAKDLIKSGKLKSAYTLSQYQTNLTDHIGVIGELLTTFSKLGRNDLIDSAVNKLNQRIQAQSQEIQAIYKAQLALNLQGMGKKSNLFNDAEKIALGVQDPVKQSYALSGIAVYQKNAGQTQASNKYFSLAEEKIKEATPGFEQFSGYINLAHDYTKIGSNINAEIAMLNAEIVLIRFDAAKQEEELAMLLDTAYLINNITFIEKYSGLIRSSTYRSKALYQNIRSQLKMNVIVNFSKQLSNISDPDYSAVATALATFLETEPSKQKSLTRTAQQILMAIQDNEKRAVATSKVARYIYRQGNGKEALSLFDQALIYAQTIQNTERRDAVLMVLAMDKARVFLSESANQVADLIYANNLKTATLGMIKISQTAKALTAN